MHSGARNDATRKAAKAKEVLEFIQSKQGLAPDPNALAAATQQFTEADDIRKQMQSRFTKFTQDPTQVSSPVPQNNKAAADFLRVRARVRVVKGLG